MIAGSSLTGGVFEVCRGILLFSTEWLALAQLGCMAVAMGCWLSFTEGVCMQDPLSTRLPQDNNAIYRDSPILSRSANNGLVASAR